MIVVTVYLINYTFLIAFFVCLDQVREDFSNISDEIFDKVEESINGKQMHLFFFLSSFSEQLSLNAVSVALFQKKNVLFFLLLVHLQYSHSFISLAFYLH